MVPNLISKVRIDSACNEEYVDDAVDAILESATHSDGVIGDGKIFVTPWNDVFVFGRRSPEGMQDRG